MVAKSYQKLKIVKEPYMANGKMYVQVEMGNGAHKQVRWYSDKEYAKYYGPLTIDTTKESCADRWSWINEPWPWQEGGC